MRLLPQILFLVGSVPTIGGITMLVVLAPQPHRVQQHLQGLARYLMLGGAAFGAARVLSGWRPSWDMVAFMLGIGLAIAIYARENHLLALAQERLADDEDGQESGT